MIVRTLTICVALAMIAGCATYDYESTAHYREVRQNTPVLVTVTDNLDRSSSKVRALRDEMGPKAFDAVADDLAREVRAYMHEHGIAIANSESESRRQLTISLDKMQNYRLSRNILFEAVATYTAAAGEAHAFPMDSVWDPNGKQIVQMIAMPSFDPRRGTPAGRQPGQEKKLDILADILVPMAHGAVDEALLEWHPSEPALDVDSPWGNDAFNHTLFPTSPIGWENEIPYGERLVLAWETFPSERILAGSGISPDRISGVSYELYVGAMSFREYFNPPTFEGPITLTDTSFDIGDKIPWCGRIQWTFRARFMLDGHPRVTAWIPHLLTRIGAPHGIECYSVGFGLRSEFAAAAATTDRDQFQLKPLAVGDSIASIVLSPARCEIDDDACSERSYQSDTEALLRRLQYFIGQLGPPFKVVDGAELIDPGWFGEDMNWYEMTADDLLKWLTDETNRSALLDAGIRRILAVHISEWEKRSNYDVGLTMAVDIFDVEDGRRLTRVEATAQGPLRAQSGSVLFAILEGDPDELSGTPSVFEIGLWRAAEIGVLASIGAKIGYPASLLENANE